MNFVLFWGQMCGEYNRLRGPNRSADTGTEEMNSCLSWLMAQILCQFISRRIPPQGVPSRLNETTPGISQVHICSHSGRQFHESGRHSSWEDTLMLFVNEMTWWLRKQILRKNCKHRESQSDFFSFSLFFQRTKVEIETKSYNSSRTGNRWTSFGSDHRIQFQATHPVPKLVKTAVAKAWEDTLLTSPVVFQLAAPVEHVMGMETKRRVGWVCEPMGFLDLARPVHHWFQGCVACFVCQLNGLSSRHTHKDECNTHTYTKWGGPNQTGSKHRMCLSNTIYRITFSEIFKADKSEIK